MRLDHLLSRERIQREIRGFSPGRYTEESVWSSKELKAEEAKNPRSETQSGRMTVLLLEPVSFSGIARARTECTLKTAQPDGKHLVKKPVAKLWKQSMRAEMRTILQLVSGERNYQRL